MCGIMGISFAPGSTISRRKFTSALLTESTQRGRDASGYAWVGPNNTNGIFKKDVPGSQLYTGNLPQEATAVIAHTRAATHGSPQQNENNHPIESPGGYIRLVHNGVISNHHDVREYFDKNIQKALPDVDSSVIGATIEAFGLDQTDILEGYAAAAWFDSDTGDTIHVARFKTSPVTFAFLGDGSFAFASTAQILHGALKKMNLTWFGSYPTPFDSMDEGDYYQVIGGEVVNTGDVNWSTKTSSSWSNWRNVTEGHTTSGAPKAGTVDPSTGAKASGSTYTVNGKTTDEIREEFARDPDVQKAIEVGKAEETPMALTKENGELTSTGKAVAQSLLDQRGSEESTLFSPEMDDPDYEEDTPSGEVVAPFRDQFFAVNHDGNYDTFLTLGALLTSLSWHSKLTAGENVLAGPEEGHLRWVNHFADVGHLSTDGSDELSWVKTEGAFEMYKAQVPQWVGDGISKLRNLVGA